MKILCFFITLTLTAASAQPPPGRGFFAWWDSPIAQDLNLKEDQNQQIREVVRNFRNKLIDQRSVMDKAEGDLEDVFNDQKVDQRKAADAIERLANARADMSRAMSQMSLKLRTILTVQQWQELQKRMPKRPPGSPPPPGQGRMRSGDPEPRRTPGSPPGQPPPRAMEE